MYKNVLSLESSAM